MTEQIRAADKLVIVLAFLGLVVVALSMVTVELQWLFVGTAVVLAAGAVQYVRERRHAGR